MVVYVEDTDSNRRKNTKRNPKHTLKDPTSRSGNDNHDYESEVFKSNNTLFENIIGYDNIKKIFSYAIASNLPVHILLVGPPGSAKTLFLMECMNLQRSYFTLGSHSTKAGMVDYLFTNRPRNLIIDEIEYMPIKDQAVLLSLMETGILSETKFEKTRKSIMKTWVFASCNDEKKLLTPLLSRFLILHFKKYNYDIFLKITKHLLIKECNLESNVSIQIAHLVWNKLKSRDIRDCIKIGRLSKNIEDVNLIVNTLRQYKKNKTDLID
ncbi:MAG: ATP-binding protein [Thermoproteota archaeon]|nr:ATP-binding protein [Thermoproteota archaeon]